jgi:hypothetical protein
VVKKGGKKPRKIRITKRTFNSETYLYLQKYFFVWEALDEFATQSAQNGESASLRCLALEAVSGEGGAGLGVGCDGPRPD